MKAFETPSGLVGRLAGHIMANTNQPLQRDVLPLVDLHPGQRVLEVGHGPGEMIALLLRVPRVTVVGVDPSRTMHDMARRRNHGAGARLDLRLAAAGDTGLPAEAFDRIVVVNNIRVWADIKDGLRELRRVSAAGARLIVADHSQHSKARRARRLAPTDEQLTLIADALESLYDRVQRHRLTYADAIIATRDV